jgi:hypothetical protein
VEGVIPVTHETMSWMVEHVAWLLTVRLRGLDGRTAYHRVRGRNFGKRLLEFGERCLYKLPMKGPRHDERGKLAERWRRGIFLGFARQSCEYVLWDDGRLVRSRCHQRVRSELRWPAGVHETITLGPHSTYAALEAEKFGPADAEPRGEPEAAERRRPQTVQIKRADWEVHGSTPGCAKCAHAGDHGWGFSSGSHSPECVERYTKWFMETERGRERVKRAEERQARDAGRRGAGEKKLEAARPEAAPGPPEAPAGHHDLLERFLQEQERNFEKNSADDIAEGTDPGDEVMGSSQIRTRLLWLIKEVIKL